MFLFFLGPCVFQFSFPFALEDMIMSNGLIHARHYGKVNFQPMCIILDFICR